MTRPLALHPDRLFPADPRTRDIARALYAPVRDLPIVSPHGHTDPAWFATNAPFADPAAAADRPRSLRVPDALQPGRAARGARHPDAWTAARPRAIRAQIWRLFAEHYHLFRGTPSRLWLDWVFAEVFGLDVRLEAETADLYYDTIDAALKTDAFRPRALFERFGIELIATTESPLDPLDHHRAIRESGWGGRVVTAYRPDPVIDPEYPGFADNLVALRRDDGRGCLDLRRLSARARKSPRLLPRGRRDLDRSRPSQRLHRRSAARRGRGALRQDRAAATSSRGDAELFRGQMLTEMARMSLDDGMVMQIHPGVVPQPQCAAARPLRPRQGRRHPDRDRICPRAEAVARPLRQRAAADR